MTAEELQVDIRKQKIVGNAYATITLCTLLLMGWGVHKFTDHLAHQEAMLSRIDSRNNAVSSLRIENCHRISNDGVEAMKMMSTAMIAHSKTMTQVEESVRDLRVSVDRNTAKIEQLIMK